MRTLTIEETKPKAQSLLPFNFEEALGDPERVVYSSGERPQEWKFFEKADKSDNCIVSICKEGDILSHRIDGGFGSRSSHNIYHLMLLPIPEKRYWVNVYNIQGRIEVSRVFSSKKDAFNEIQFPLKLLKTISFTI